MKRIRYKETFQKGIFVSTANVESATTGAIYSIEYNLNSMTYRIVNINSGRAYESNKPVGNLNVLKRNIRDKLVELGVELKTEVRNLKTIVKPWLGGLRIKKE